MTVSTVMVTVIGMAQVVIVTLVLVEKIVI